MLPPAVCFVLWVSKPEWTGGSGGSQLCHQLLVWRWIKHCISWSLLCQSIPASFKRCLDEAECYLLQELMVTCPGPWPVLKPLAAWHQLWWIYTIGISKHYTSELLSLFSWGDYLLAHHWNKVMFMAPSGVCVRETDIYLISPKLSSELQTGIFDCLLTDPHGCLQGISA